MRKSIILCAGFIFLLFSCSSDESNTDISVVGNWIIQEITYNGSHVNWGECGPMENITFTEEGTFAWQLYARDSDDINCIPIPPTTGTWEEIDDHTVQLTDGHDEDIVVVFTYDATFLILETDVEPSEEEPDGIHIRFVFLRS